MGDVRRQVKGIGQVVRIGANVHSECVGSDLPLKTADRPASPDLEILAAFVHGTVALGNALGLLYNIRRKQWRWCAVHAIGVALHAYATREHAKELSCSD